MKSVSPSKIYNSTLRGVEETPAYKRFYTFHFKDYQNEFRESFGELEFLNDESLSPQQNITYKHEEDMCILLLPVAGAINYQDQYRTELVKPEQVKILSVGKGFCYALQNPFEKEWINYLHLGFKASRFLTEHSSITQNIGFKKINELVGFGADSHANGLPTGCIGIYDGRRKGSYALKNPGNGLFVYIIRGAFEVHGRLMEYRDGLSLWDTGEIEFEALSNNAIILLLEIKLK